MDARGFALQEILAVSPRPTERVSLGAFIQTTLEKVPATSSAEYGKNAWENALRREVLDFAAKEGAALKRADTTYYADLRYRLDIALILAELDICDPTTPFTVLQDLLEAQTVASCSQIFTWIESRGDRLRAGLVPNKGKALVLLRTLNDLLKRVSRTGRAAPLSGRILTFLAGAFAINERSAVNLRADFGPEWQDVHIQRDEMVKAVSEKKDDEMQVDSAESSSEVAGRKAQEKADFYNVFWSVQKYFARPTVFNVPDELPKFKDAIEKIIPVIKEASAKDRALMGSKAGSATAMGASTKRKRGAEDPAPQNYFFAKFLTSPELLDLEIADVHFRRQVLVQLLVLLHTLLAHAADAKAATSMFPNKNVTMDFTLPAADEGWAKETIARAHLELTATAPKGTEFDTAVRAMLAREKNWVRWKFDFCKPIHKEPWSDGSSSAAPAATATGNGEPQAKENVNVTMWEATAEIREAMNVVPPKWPHDLGSETLTEIWAMGYRDLRDIQSAYEPADLADFAKRIATEDKRIDMRRRQLMQQAERTAAARAKAEESRAAAAAAAEKAKEEEANATKDVAMGEAPATTTTTSRATDAGSTTAEGSTRADAAAPTAAAPAPAAPIPAPLVLPPDAQLDRFEEAKTRLAWLALRTVRDKHSLSFVLTDKEADGGKEKAGTSKSIDFELDKIVEHIEAQNKIRLENKEEDEKAVAKAAAKAANPRKRKHGQEKGRGKEQKDDADTDADAGAEDEEGKEEERDPSTETSEPPVEGSTAAALKFATDQGAERGVPKAGAEAQASGGRDVKMDEA